MIDSQLPLDQQPNDVPPLGQPPAFITEELTQRAETREQIDSIEHRSIDELEDMGEVFTELNNFTQVYRKRYGAEERPLDPASIRVYDDERMAQLVEILPDAENGGIFDPETDASHILRREPFTMASTLTFVYAMAHEVGHAQTNALNGGYNRLGSVVREGQADRFAKEFLTTTIPKLYPGVAENTQNFVSGMPKLPVIKGVQIEAADIIFAVNSTDGIEASGFSRILEMRAMEAIEQEVGAESFNGFMYRALTDDTSAIPFLSDQLGRDFWLSITTSDNELVAIDVLQALQANTAPEYDRTTPHPITDNSERVAAGLATPLPGGFTYGKVQNPGYEDIENLLRTTYSEELVWNMYMKTRAVDLKAAGLRSTDIMIRNGDRLVGYSNIISKGAQGEMTDLIVHPDARHQGLAKALILERLAMAEQQGIDSLFIPPLSQQNTLASFYTELGFTRNNDGSFSRGPDAHPILPMS